MYFKCNYCGDKYKREDTLIKHLCEKKRKTLLLETSTGKTAYICYQNWRNLNKFFFCDRETFLNSKYFKSFINFIEFCKDKSIPEKNGFIKMMVTRKIQPSMWCNDMYYEEYIKLFDTIYSPIKQVEMSLETLYRLSTLFNCAINDIFANMQPLELFKMFHCKKLSPWLLLLMKSFQKFIKFQITEQDSILLSTIVDSKIWSIKFKENEETVNKIKKLLVQLNIQ